MEFHVPLHVQDLELAKADRYYVHDPLLLNDATATDVLTGRLRELEDEVLKSDGGLALLQENELDMSYAFLRKLPTMNDTMQLRVVQMFSSFVSHVTNGVRAADEVENKEDARNAFKAAVYFLIMALMEISRLQVQGEKDILKKGKKKQADTLTRVYWTKAAESAIVVLDKSIRPSTFGLWNMNLPEEEFAILYCKVVFLLLENPSLCRGRTLKPKLYQLLARCLKQVPSINIPAVSSLLDAVYAHEHLSGSIAELVELIHFKHENLTFAADLISEIGRISTRETSKDVAGTKNMSTFLSSLSTRMPSLVLGNLSFVLALLDSESYQLRNAAVTCVTQILLWNFEQQAKNPTEEPVTTQPATPRRKKAGNSDSEDSDEEEKDGEEEDEQEGGESPVPENTADKDSAPRTLSRETRNQLLSVLEDRVFDVNSFARSHVLKMWYLLNEKGAVPVQMLKSVTEMAVGRLHDKAAVVRRNSINLLTLLLATNPFMGNLEREFYVSKAKEVRDEIKEKRNALIADAEMNMHDAMQEASSNRRESLQTFVAQENSAELELELQKLERVGQFYLDAIEFIDEYEVRALPLMAQLLGSKSSTDVHEAIQFFGKAYQFRLTAAQSGIKKMLPLIWRSDTSTQEQVLKTFVSLFIEIDHASNDRATSEAIAENLLKLIDDCTVAEFTCLEKILGELHRKKEIPRTVIASLWNFVDETQFPVSVVTNALSLLSMIASVDEAVLVSNDRLSQVLINGFGDLACNKDSTCRIFGAACRLVQCLQLEASTNGKINMHKRVNRSTVETTREIVERIQRFLALDFFTDEQLESAPSSHSTLFDSVKQAIDALFVVCERPEEICGDVLKHLSARLFQNGTSSVSALGLAHLMFVLGHVAVQVAVHVERLATTVKKLRASQDHSHENDGKAQGGEGDTSSGDAAADVTAMEDELGVAAEVEAEEDTYVYDMIQKDIACQNLLGSYGPLIIGVLHGGNTETEDEVLTECAVVALSKFMAVSDVFCEKHLQLLFTILIESPLPSVRGDVIVALGDLSFRFPNLIEPWTSHLYNRLRDVNIQVRKNTIVVLSHLILNDMIKVKGQVSEIAFSLVDDEEQIRNAAKLFFHELSKKGNNPIYNMLPDAIGQLSSSELVTNANFEEITRFLIQFLTKEKQIESIVEKLSQRFPAASQVQQQRDLSFCLSHLPHTEKSLRYLAQNRKLFLDALTDSTCVDNFSHLISKTRRANSSLAATSEMKEAIDGLEQLITHLKGGGDADPDSAPVTEERRNSLTPQSPSTAGAKKARKSKTKEKEKSKGKDKEKRTRTRTKSAVLEEKEEDEEEEEDAPPVPKKVREKPTAKKTRGKGKKKKKPIVASSDEDSK